MSRYSETSGTLDVLLGTFDPLLARGLAGVLSAAAGVRVLALDIPDEVFEESVHRHRPAVAVLGDTADHLLIRRLTSHRPPTAVLVVADRPTHLMGTTLIAIGATCVAQSVASDDLLSALRLAADGGRTFVAVDGSETKALSGISRLTRREREVYEYLRRGSSYADIALKLQIGYETVRTHSRRVCEKLGVANRLELIGAMLPAAGAD
jgi:DNA-binding NarL/FixJ family response regulator